MTAEERDALKPRLQEALDEVIAEDAPTLVEADAEGTRVVTLGGLGTAYGALFGSIIVGLFIQLSTLVIPTDMKNVGALLMLIVILLIRPQGLFGRRERIG